MLAYVPVLGTRDYAFASGTVERRCGGRNIHYSSLPGPEVRPVEGAGEFSVDGMRGRSLFFFSQIGFGASFPTKGFKADM